MICRKKVFNDAINTLRAMLLMEKGCEKCGRSLKQSDPVRKNQLMKLLFVMVPGNSTSHSSLALQMYGLSTLSTHPGISSQVGRGRPYFPFLADEC